MRKWYTRRCLLQLFFLCLTFLFFKSNCYKWARWGEANRSGIFTSDELGDISDGVAYLDVICCCYGNLRTREKKVESITHLLVPYSPLLLFSPHSNWKKSRAVPFYNTIFFLPCRVVQLCFEFRIEREKSSESSSIALLHAGLVISIKQLIPTCPAASPDSSEAYIRINGDFRRGRSWVGERQRWRVGEYWRIEYHSSKVGCQLKCDLFFFQVSLPTLKAKATPRLTPSTFIKFTVINTRTLWQRPPSKQVVEEWSEPPP